MGASISPRPNVPMLPPLRPLPGSPLYREAMVAKSAPPASWFRNPVAIVSTLSRCRVVALRGEEEQDLGGGRPGAGHVGREPGGEFLVGDDRVDLDDLLPQPREHHFLQWLLGDESHVE